MPTCGIDDQRSVHRPFGGFHSFDLAILHLDSCHLRKGVDLYAQLLGFGCIPPHYGIVPGNAARRLKNTRVHLSHLNTGGERFDLPGVHQARGHTKSVLLWHRPPAQLGRFLADR